MDRDPKIIGLHMALGDQVSRIDQLETRTFNARCGGLYKAPELPEDRADSIAGNVVLSLAYIALGRVS
jgi:hypothetical protein